MKTLKTLALAAAGTVLTVASLSAQTAVGQMQWAGVGPNSVASHEGDIPNSGVAAFPMITRPARSKRCTISEV